MDVFFTQLGCKLNQAEIEDLARRFQAAGHTIVESIEAADLHVVNSCTVTHMAARDSRKVARRGARTRRPRERPLRTVLTGCYATHSPEEAEALAGVDLVVLNEDKHRLLEIVHDTFPEDVPTLPEQGVPVSYVGLPAVHTRAAVKIEDGCNMGCSFCIIPTTRGRQRSRDLRRVVAEVRGLAESGVQEVVVTGVQISSYRHGDTRLPDVVAALLDDTDLPRIRLSSIAPWQFDERLFDLFSSPRVCRHVHLSLQSGCDATLKRMRRPYDGAVYASLVERLRLLIPGIAITTDVIVAFPGEDEAEFEQSLRFVEEMAFAKVHAFPYSSREGTRAAALTGHLDPATKKRRMAQMLEAAARSEQAFVAAQLGRELEVLWEEERIAADGAATPVWRGTTDNYVRVEGDGPLSALLEPRCLDRVVANGRSVIACVQPGRPGREPPAANDSSLPILPRGLVV